MSAYDTLEDKETQELNLSIIKKYYKGKRIDKTRICAEASKCF